MSRKCTVCEHAERTDIEKAMINNESLRNLSKRFGISSAAAARHKKSHLPEVLVKSGEAREIARRVEVAAAADVREAGELGRAAGVMKELERCLKRTNPLCDACDTWLRDPEDPERYDISPRAEDIKITLTEFDAEGKPTRRKKRLSQLLDDLRERTGLEVKAVEFKHADPRKLILDAIGELREQIRLQMDLLKTAYSIEEVSRFQQIVVEEIGRADPEIQRQIIARLEHAHTVRSVIEQPQD